MSTTQGPTPEAISKEEFQHIAGQYDTVLERVSKSTTTRAGQKSLAELDAYRYGEAPRLFSRRDLQKAMGLDDVKTLVEWKLMHGKFRPRLMALVSSNEESFVSSTIQSALEAYERNEDASKAVHILTKLRGIGPATASLLLAVHNPESVIFFADEAFYWFCSNGKRVPIKYDAKEYNELNKRAGELARRISVSAVDMERVAYVLMRGGSTAPPRSEKPSSSVTKDVALTKTEATSKLMQSRVAKRKQSDAVTDVAPTRRCKR